ncbi:MAG TPA: hypothetical protein VEN31_01690 [Candidatus Bathyarchaeia archaeon]|nr:hypothetical protein [Candidatus Bathyarchaeia archaeon]
MKSSTRMPLTRSLTSSPDESTITSPPVVAIGSKDKLRMLAVTTRVRSEVLPDVQTIAETVLPV